MLQRDVLSGEGGGAEPFGAPVVDGGPQGLVAPDVSSQLTRGFFQYWIII